MLAIIGGTGLTDFTGLEIIDEKKASTAYGNTSSDLMYAQFHQQKIIFLSRHGKKHNIPPHKVNYLANISALKEAGVTDIIAVNAVGGIHPDFGPGAIVFPNQIIDYTHSREGTFFSSGLEKVTHIDFTNPYSQVIIDALVRAANKAGINSNSNGTYACTQGPRLETAAEIKRLKNDGCDLVGMTGMPEAALAKELEMNYASISVVANWGAGLSDQEISMDDIEAVLVTAMDQVKQIISAYIEAI